MNSKDMIRDIRAYGLEDKRVFQAMEKIPRHMFVTEENQHLAYADSALRTLCEQTISQPYTVAFMLMALDLAPGQKVLEIGAGTGWSAALMQELVNSFVD